ncbi:predicted O-methyltransferase [Chthonomonas calidirosea]|uniref:O-methyltransferase n=1 Tax=Chthonomonas calidirosea TaxID=454171 RepID=UPI0006DD3F81|nr:O-methyltransferase [Chthonomonas calidirosea]CEK17452.1 predicted O-methyltransferase [Chthonomonas calidirosea]
MPDLFHPQMMGYLESLVPQRHEVMLEMEARAREIGFPIIGIAGGQFLYQIARMMKATRIFELGSGYGYSTAWFARAVRENGGGVVHHVVWDEKLSSQAKDYLGRLGYSDIVQFHVAEAVETLKATEEHFDLIFNDIDKVGYPASIPVIKERLRPGGVLLVDNMFLHGSIFDPTNTSEAVQAVRTTTKLLTQDPQFISSLIPIRDGIMLSYYVP